MQLVTLYMWRQYWSNLGTTTSYVEASVIARQLPSLVTPLPHQLHNRNCSYISLAHKAAMKSLDTIYLNAFIQGRS